MKVKDLMTPRLEMKTVNSRATVKHVISLMRAHNIGSVVVLADEAKPIGIITQRDIINSVVQNVEKILDLPVTDVMSKSLVTIYPDATVNEAAELMNKNRIHHLIVVNEQTGELAGILSSYDILIAHICMDDIKNLLNVLPACYQFG